MSLGHPDPGGIGVGVVYSGALAERLAATPDLVDMISVIPETLWHESSGRRRYRWIGEAVDLFDAAVASIPPVFHGIGLSLGSGLPLDVGHLDQVVAAAARYQPRWYSEHLAAFRIRHRSGQLIHAGVGLPVPLDVPTLRELVPKVATVVSRLGLSVLIENSAVYVEIPDADMSEAEFLNRLCAETGAGLLLDLHNLVVNEINLGWIAEAYLSELDLTRVEEIHVAGGEVLGRWYTDAHSGACPDRVWALLDAVLPLTPNLRLVTFELHESRLDQLGPAGLDAQLDRIRSSTAAIASYVA
jgi:uncharacterized protein (UPF0276 family)